MNNRGKLIVISGPSGAGKSTVIGKVLDSLDNASFSVSMTTRKASPTEVDGRDYFFVDQDTFDKTIAEGGFLEYDRHMGNSYGTPRAAVESSLASGSNVILDIDVKGGAQVKQSMPETVMVFLMPPSMEELERRLRTRNRDSEDQLRTRLARAEYECSRAGEYDYVIINDDADAAARQLAGIINA